MLLDISNIISIIEIIVNVFFIIIISVMYQNSKDKSRVLKDYYINQINKIQLDFEFLTSEIYGTRIKSVDIHRSFIRIQSQISSLENVIKNNFLIEINLFAKIIPIQQIIEESSNYNMNSEEPFNLENEYLEGFDSCILDINEEIHNSIASLNNSMKKSKMNTLLKRIIIIIPLLCLVSCSCKDPNSESNTKLIEAVEKKVDVQDDKIELLEKELKDLSDKIDKLEIKK